MVGNKDGTIFNTCPQSQTQWFDLGLLKQLINQSQITLDSGGKRGGVFLPFKKNKIWSPPFKVLTAWDWASRMQRQLLLLDQLQTTETMWFPSKINITFHNEFIHSKNTFQPGVVGHICNPSYLECRGRRTSV
jgi:hypothetical protein